MGADFERAAQRAQPFGRILFQELLDEVLCVRTKDLLRGIVARRRRRIDG